ncbi:MAG: CAP domain-containing protein [Candidatus Levybacteria bacterium]|nr:CAP domain-containing protein [Candidatus Levybacteria bacterium]
MHSILSYFLPHENNNYRAKLLHHKSLLFVLIIIFCASFLIPALRFNFPSVLGISADISSQKLLLIVNQKREANRLPPLILNEKLSLAAVNKAKDMFAKNYWAHNSPDGKTLWWVFIKGAGYNYVYAGENLARGFDNTDSVVNAWMESPLHRANLLSQNYKDVGFAIEEGKLSGEDTVLVVQELGGQSLEPVVYNPPKNPVKNVASAVSNNNYAVKGSLISPLSLSSLINKTILYIFIAVFILDMIVVERKKIVRFVGHNTDHISFFVMLIILIGILNKGVIV